MNTSYFKEIIKFFKILVFILFIGVVTFLILKNAGYL